MVSLLRVWEILKFKDHNFINSNFIIHSFSTLVLIKQHTRTAKKLPTPIQDSIPKFNFTDHLYYDPIKKFYCKKTLTQNTLETDPKLKKPHKCLGSGKGRSYEDMSAFARNWLNNYYMKPNQELKDWLSYNGQRLPIWLSDFD